jgi:hypothetical protein
MASTDTGGGRRQHFDTKPRGEKVENTEWPSTRWRCLPITCLPAKARAVHGSATIGEGRALMKHYKLTAWPELQAPFHGSAYRRMLCDMSHRYVSFQHLVSVSGLSRGDVRQFIEMLDTKDLVAEQEASREPDSIFDSLKPIGAWLYSALTTEIGGRR